MYSHNWHSECSVQLNYQIWKNGNFVWLFLRITCLYFVPVVGASLLHTKVQALFFEIIMKRYALGKFSVQIYRYHQSLLHLRRYQTHGKALQEGLIYISVDMIVLKVWLCSYRSYTNSIWYWYLKNNIYKTFYRQSLIAALVIGHTLKLTCLSATHIVSEKRTVRSITMLLLQQPLYFVSFH